MRSSKWDSSSTQAEPNETKGAGPRRPRRRRAVPAIEERRVWAAAAGRCEVCGEDLLEGRITHRPMTLGELAHIVGAQATKGSPRGMEALSEVDRNKAENLILVCAGHHDEIDRDGAVDIVTVDRLRALKREREAWISQVTALGRDRGTTVVRLLADVRGNSRLPPAD